MMKNGFESTTGQYFNLAGFSMLCANLDVTQVHKTPIQAMGAWSNTNFSAPEAYSLHLSVATQKEIDDALKQYREQQGKGGESNSVFPLPSLAKDVEYLLKTLDSRGFVVLKGLPVSRYTDDEAFTIYRSIGHCLGNILVQNIAGDSLMSIQDYNHDQNCLGSPSQGRIIRTNADISFHTDSVGITRGRTPDILVLFALRTAKSGGASTLISGLTLHNILLNEYSEYLERLYQPFYFARVEVTPEDVPLIFAPIFTYRGNLNVRYSIIRLLAGYEKAGIQLTNFEREVLDVFEELMKREDLILTFNLDEGDILLVNNRWILHGRTAFEDYSEIERKRRFIRMWLGCQELSGQHCSIGNDLTSNIRMI